MNLFLHFKRTGLPFIEVGIFFWLPSTIYHLVRGHGFGDAWFDIPAVTILPLLSLGAGFYWMWSSHEEPGNFGAACGYTLLGIWILGPFFQMLGGMTAGGGVSSAGGFQLAVIGTLLFPAVTFMLSTYDGTLGALMLVTLLLGSMAFLSLADSLIRRIVRRRSGE